MTISKKLKIFSIQILLSVIPLSIFISTDLSAELIIKVTKGNDKPTEIAISPIASGNINLSEDLGLIIESDLQRSGMFKTIPRQNMLAYPSTPDDVYFRDWRLLGAEYLVVGSIEQLEEKQIRFVFNLLNVNLQSDLIQHIVEGNSDQLREIAHRASDLIYEEITGIRGAFSTRLAYVTAVQNNNSLIYELKVSDADGAQEKLMLRSTEPIMSPAWSPSGKEIAYVSFESGRPAIYRQDLISAKRQQLTNFKGLNGAPAWSPDGNKLAMVLSKDGNPEIYVLDFMERKLTRLTRHFSIDTEPTWHPNGDRILFTSDRGGTPQIYELELDSRKIRRITYAGNYNARPSLAPDGRTLVMVHRANDVFHIATLDLKTNRMLELTETRLDESPTVAPNGAMLIYATKQGDRDILAAVSIDAGVKYFLPLESGDVREPAWSPYLR